MNFEEFIRKTDEISHQARGTTDEGAQKRLKNEFFDVAIDYFNENCTGDIDLADGRTIFIGAIEPEPRRIYTSYNETPTTIGNPMSEQISNAPKTPKAPSKFVQKLNSMKPSTMDDEKKAAVVGRIKMIGAFAAGVLTTVTVVATASYYNSFSANGEAATDESGEETTED